LHGRSSFCCAALLATARAGASLLKFDDGAARIDADGTAAVAQSARSCTGGLQRATMARSSAYLPTAIAPGHPALHIIDAVASILKIAEAATPAATADALVQVGWRVSPAQAGLQ
jgi:hypothetical protein